MTAVLRAIRGATTLDADTPEQVHERTRALIAAILEQNALSSEDLVSVLFTVTPDIHAGFPATAARSLGLDDVPLLGALEMAVDGALERCVRVLVHCYTERARGDLRHVYLEGATVLRRDLAR